MLFATAANFEAARKRSRKVDQIFPLRAHSFGIATSGSQLLVQALIQIFNFKKFLTKNGTQQMNSPHTTLLSVVKIRLEID